MGSCTTVDPGPNFVVPDEQFDADFFFCHVEPEVLTLKKCGPGDPGAGDKSNGCHFNSSAVSGMAITSHPTVDCAIDELVVTKKPAGLSSGAPNFAVAQSIISGEFVTQ